VRTGKGRGDGEGGWGVAEDPGPRGARRTEQTVNELKIAGAKLTIGHVWWFVRLHLEPGNNKSTEQVRSDLVEESEKFGGGEGLDWSRGGGWDVWYQNSGQQTEKLPTMFAKVSSEKERGKSWGERSERVRCFKQTKPSFFQNIRVGSGSIGKRLPSTRNTPIQTVPSLAL